jgi:Icc protein
MAYVIAQLSDIHIGGPHPGNGARCSAAIAEINAMTRAPDLVLLTGDLTQDGSPGQWAELRDRLADLTVPWEAMPGNHDQLLTELAGHRSVVAGPLRLVLLDTSHETFTEDDERWLDTELSAHPGEPVVVAIHHPPFETGIWWMDCIGLTGRERVERVVRRHPQVIQVLSGHIHRLIHTNWGGCSLWVCPSTAVSVAVDLDPAHDPAETAEPPTFSLHAYTDAGVVSHVVPVGPPARRTAIGATSPEFVERVRDLQATRPTHFA